MRAPIVLLRPFTVDIHDEEDTFEEHVAKEVAPYGPFIAIGKPGDDLPPVGASRNYYLDDTWKDGVAKWIAESQAVIAIWAPSSGLDWELDHIKVSGQQSKLIILLPANTEALDETDKRWGVVRPRLAALAPRDDLPQNEPEGLVAVFIGADSEIVLLVGPGLYTSIDYTRAINHFLSTKFA
jgi:hypothetical protein